MIIGTAGHIDHGKTTLVRALTGVDTDRLPQEKQRGISIELGYAFMDGPGGQRIGFIDVPGHERLVHTMVSGATGIDHALLLVAADDGVMPQTREHLAVLSLLGVTSGTVVVTKADRADGARLAEVEAEAAALVQGTSLAGSPVLTVSAHDGRGLQALRARLTGLVGPEGASAQAAADRAFRLAIDRVFTVEGAGTVVTGTVHAGTVVLGDTLARCGLGLAPTPRTGPGFPGGVELLARVRSVHAQGRAVGRAVAGERCALGLAGVPKEALRRGQWLVDPAVALQTDRLDVRLTLWGGEARALRSGTPVHVHLGAAATQGTVAMLDAGDALAPGGTARLQLVLREPIGAWRGDRVILRDASAARTLAGGVVIDPLAPVRYRRTPQRLAELDAQERADAASRLQALLEAAEHGLDLPRLQACEGARERPVPPTSALVARAEGRPVQLLGTAWHAQAASSVLQALTAYHAAHPEELGPDAARLRRLAVPRLTEPLWRALLAGLQGDGRLVVAGTGVHLPEHGERLSEVDERIRQKIAPLIGRAGFEGAWARDLARDAGESEPLMRVTLARLARRGELHQVVRDLVYPTETMRRLAAIARQAAAADGGEVTAARFRDATGLGRKRAIQILECFDRIGLTRRVGDTHRLRTDTQLLADDGQRSAR